jgi:hypothetical protein
MCCHCCACRCNSLRSYGLASDGHKEHYVTIHDDARDSKMVIKSENPDAVVWNPWVTKSKARAGRAQM